MLHLLDSVLLEDYDDALYYIIDELLVLVCGVSAVTESDGWHETPALNGTPAEPVDHTAILSTCRLLAVTKLPRFV